MRKLDTKTIKTYKNYLLDEEKSKATIEKYIRDLKAFSLWTAEGEINKRTVLEYKEKLISCYKPRSVNSILSSLNSLFDFMDWQDCKVNTIKIQRQIFADKNKELSKDEYDRLLKAAKDKKNVRLYNLMQTICSTGIRVSELRFITVEAVNGGRANISCKGKMRTVILPKQLCKILKKYLKEQNIKSGSVFISKDGKPLNRTNIWADMKSCVRQQEQIAQKYSHIICDTCSQERIILLSVILFALQTFSVTQV